MKLKNLFTLQFLFDILFSIAYLSFTYILFNDPSQTYWAWFATSTVVFLERWVSHLIWLIKYIKFKKTKKIEIKNKEKSK